MNGQHKLFARLLCGSFIPFLLLLAACRPAPPAEKQIMMRIEQLQQLAEKKQLRSVMDFFSDDFQGPRDRNKAALQGRLFFHFRYNPTVRVYISNIDIQVNEDGQARVSCHFLATGSQDVMPDKGRLYRVESSWRKEDGAWRIYYADWEDAINELVAPLKMH